MRPSALLRILPSIVTALGCSVMSAAASAAEMQNNIVPLVWTCAQSHDAAFHVVCQPTCPAVPGASARMQPAVMRDPPETRPAWGHAARFRSARQPPIAAMDTLDGDDVPDQCSQTTRTIDRSSDTTRPTAAHLNPIAERRAAEIFTGKPWKVPLYSRPTDPAAVTRLLREVLCGDAACSVQYAPNSSTHFARH